MSLIKVSKGDSSHWYTPDGQPFHEIANASKAGEMRPVTLRDARKHGLYPSVTNVLGIMHKPNLQRWMVEQGILAALTLPRLDAESDDLFAARAMEDAAREAKVAADWGTRMHNCIEQILTGVTVTPDEDQVDYAQAFEVWWNGNCGQFVNCIADFKTQGTRDDFNFYDEWCYQLAAYLGAVHGDAPMGRKTESVVVNRAAGYAGRVDYVHDAGSVLRCANVAISSKVPGLIEAKFWKLDELNRGEEVFLAANHLWKKVKKYDPSHVKEIVHENV